MSRPARAALIAAAAMAVLVPLLSLAMMAATDRGWLDRPIAGWLSHRLGRSVRFASLEAHLLSAAPSITVRGARIANPPWAGHADVVAIGRLTARVRPWSLLIGRPDIPELVVENPVLDLIRLGPGRNNWSLGHGAPGRAAFAPLRGVARLVVTGGRLLLQDRARGLVFQGRFAHDPALAMPYRLSGGGMLKGGAITVEASGARLNGPGVGDPYAFAARIVDGRTLVEARGVSVQPFDLTGYDLAMKLSGPNLADLTYLFSLQTPNSAPFAMTGRARSQGAQVSFTDLRGRVGGSDFSGRIASDRSRARHHVRAALRFGRWTRADITAALEELPSRAAARDLSGAIRAGPPGRWLLSDRRFDVRRLRAVDLDADLAIAALTGFAVPMRDARATMALADGRLDFSHVAARVYDGALSASGRIDARAAIPRVAVRAALRSADLAAIPGMARGIGGQLAIVVDLRGRGRSLHDAAADASGMLAIRIARGRAPRAAALLIGGDLLRAAGSLGDTRRRIAIACATAGFAASGGRLDTRDLVIETPAGITNGTGSIDLRTERIDLLLAGRPVTRRLFQLAVPVRIAGPLATPAVTLLPGTNARRLGLTGRLGLALSPVAALLPLGRAAAPARRCRREE